MTRVHVVLFAFVVLLAVGSGGMAHAGISATEVSRFEVPLFSGGLNVGSVYGEYPHEPVLAGRTLYVPLGASSNVGFLSFDLSDPAAPRFGGQFSAIRSRDVAVAGNFLYSVDGRRLHVLNVSVPSNPVLLGTLDFLADAAAVSVAVRGSIAFVAGTGGFFGSAPPFLRAVDVSIPGSPRVVGSLNPGGADIFVAGNFAYVADYANGLRVYDITNPAAMQVIGSAGTLAEAVKVQVVGTVAYVFNTAPRYAISTLDVADPAHPALIKTVVIPDELINSDFGFSSEPPLFNMRVAGGRAYLSGWRGVVVVNVANPAAPAIEGLIGPAAWAGGVEFLDDLLVDVNSLGIFVLRLGAAPEAAGGPALDAQGKLVLDGTDSSDPDGTVVMWRWHVQEADPAGPSFDLAGAVVALGGVPSGVYEVSLTVEDEGGAQSQPLRFPLAIPITADPEELAACRADVLELETALAAARARIAELEGSLAEARQVIAGLEDLVRQLSATNSGLELSVAEGLRGLEEIELLFRTPAGQRRSASDYTGALGDRLDAIVDLLVAAPGKGR